MRTRSAPPASRRADSWQRLALCGALLTTVSCAQPVPADPRETLAQIRTLVGDTACRSDDQCRVLPLGSRPCGGPESYLAWSTASTDQAALAALADRYQSQRQVEHQKSGRLSTCEVLPAPAVACVRAAADPVGRCVLQPGGRSAQVR